MNELYRKACTSFGKIKVDNKILDVEKSKVREVFFNKGRRLALYIDEELIYTLELVCSKNNASRIIIPRDLPQNEAIKLATGFGASVMITGNSIEDIGYILINKHFSSTLDSQVIVGFLTSGTTGVPKIVVKNESSLIRETELVLECLDITYEDKLIINVKLSHSFGYFYGVITVAILGISVEYMNPKNVNILNCDNINTGRIIFVTSPINVKKILKSTVDKMIIISAGSELIYSEEIEKLNKLIIYDQYGSTESGVIWINEYCKKNEGNRQFVFSEIRTDLESGISFIKNDYLMIGYMNHVGKIERQFEFESTDIICQENNVYKIIGRFNNVINKNGEKIFPERVECFIEKMKGINSSLVYIKKNKLIALISSKNEVDTLEIVNYLNKHLPSYAVPKIYKYAYLEEIIDDNGKKKRR